MMNGCVHTLFIHRFSHFLLEMIDLSEMGWINDSEPVNWIETKEMEKKGEKT